MSVMQGISATGIDVDVSHWPTVIFRQHVDMDTQGLKDALQWWDTHMGTREEPYGLIIDARGSERMSAVHRKLIIDRMEKNRNHAKYCAGAAFVFESSFMRGILNAILWVASPAYPVRTFAAPEPALSWTESLVQARAA